MAVGRNLCYDRGMTKKELRRKLEVRKMAKMSPDKLKKQIMKDKGRAETQKKAAYDKKLRSIGKYAYREPPGRTKSTILKRRLADRRMRQAVKERGQAITSAGDKIRKREAVIKRFGADWMRTRNDVREKMKLGRASSGAVRGLGGISVAIPIAKAYLSKAKSQHKKNVRRWKKGDRPKSSARDMRHR